MLLRDRNACPPSQLPKRHRRPSAHLATGDIRRAWFHAQAHARRAVRCQRALAASDAMFSIKEVDVGQAADLGTPARIIGNVSLLHRLALSVHTVSARGSRCVYLVFCRASYLVLGRRSCTLLLSLRRSCGDGPVVITGPKSCMRSIIRAFCIFVPFADELISQCSGF